MSNPPCDGFSAWVAITDGVLDNVDPVRDKPAIQCWER